MMFPVFPLERLDEEIGRLGARVYKAAALPLSFFRHPQQRSVLPLSWFFSSFPPASLVKFSAYLLSACACSAHPRPQACGNTFINFLRSTKYCSKELNFDMLSSKTVFLALAYLSWSANALPIRREVPQGTTIGDIRASAWLTSSLRAQP